LSADSVAQLITKYKAAIGAAKTAATTAAMLVR
jgi:hypothetical protein